MYACCYCIAIVCMYAVRMLHSNGYFISFLYHPFPVVCVYISGVLVIVSARFVCPA